MHTVTLVLSLHSRDTFWLVADRRLSYQRGAPVVEVATDSAVKVVTLTTLDGVAVLGYAGLGATVLGTQPSEWISAVLRGRGGLTLEQALGYVATAATKELPRHLANLPGGAHFIVVPAFIRDVGPRLYSIDNVINPQTREHVYRFTIHQRTAIPGLPSPRIGIAGSGSVYLRRSRDGWARDLLRRANAHDRGKVSDDAIANRLAKLSFDVHQNTRDGSVGPRSIVVWRRRPEVGEVKGGGAHAFFTGTDREDQTDGIPTISNGMDVDALCGVIMRETLARFANNTIETAPPMDQDAVDEQLAKLPWEPDDKLR